VKTEEKKKRHSSLKRKPKKQPRETIFTGPANTGMQKNTAGQREKKKVRLRKRGDLNGPWVNVKPPLIAAETLRPSYSVHAVHRAKA